MAFESMASPLGMGQAPQRRGIPARWRVGLVVLLAMVVSGLLAGALFKQSRAPAPTGAVAIITRQAENVASAIPPPAKANPPAEAQPERQITKGGGLIIKVPDSGAPAAEAQFDARVGERTDMGILPVVAASGHKAWQVYSRPFAAKGKPMLAIVMTGVGISPRGTEAAIRRLPGEVTLAFAPYGRDLIAQSADARAAGHELLLQVPMEPSNYPQSDPGPQTLRAGQAAAANAARLRWLMSRFPGYVGLTNFMGSQLMRDPAAYGPLLEEMNRRGVAFLDDGTTGSALTPSLAAKINLPSAVADRVVETGGSESLDEALKAAEQLARSRGRAVITVPALPANIDRVAAYAKVLAERGLVLAPISAIMTRNAP